MRGAILSVTFNILDWIYIRHVTSSHWVTIKMPWLSTNSSLLYANVRWRNDKLWKFLDEVTLDEMLQLTVNLKSMIETPSLWRQKKLHDAMRLNVMEHNALAQRKIICWIGDDNNLLNRTLFERLCSYNIYFYLQTKNQNMQIFWFYLCFGIFTIYWRFNLAIVDPLEGLGHIDGPYVR